MTNDQPPENHVPVSEIMTVNVVTTTADRPVDDVARELRARGYGGMPVVNDAGILVGMVSEYDIISKRGRTVDEIMSRGVISAGDEASADQVASLMSLHGIRRVPIVRDGRLVGIVSRSDLLQLYTLVRWTCQSCGDFERGFVRPERCARCGGTDLQLDRERRTGEGF